MPVGGGGGGHGGRNYQAGRSEEQNFDILNSFQTELQEPSFPSSKREGASYCSRSNANPPRQEAHRQSKSKQSLENYLEIDAILS